MSSTASASPLAALLSGWSLRDSAMPAPSPRPMRRDPGPVLMADIHTRWGGQPGLLLLWAQWEEAVRDRDRP